MVTESSKKPKAKETDKFYGKRYIAFPRELFIELKLSKAQIEKVRAWDRAGHTFFPMWFASFRRILIVNEELFHGWIERKGKP